MRTADAIASLTRHQDGVIVMIDRAERMLSRGPDFAQDLGRMRWELTRLLRAYQIFKHAEVFDPAIASGRLADVQLARELKARCIAAGDVFRAYTLEWSGRDTVGEWDAYEPAMLIMAAKLRAHIAMERREIARSLEQVTDTRRRA